MSAKLIDRLLSVPLAALFAGGTVVLGAEALRGGESLLAALGLGASALYYLLQALFILIRRPPIASARSVTRVVVVLAGIAMPAVALMLPRYPLSGPLALIAPGLVLAGAAGSILVIGYLGRSFSILPQARGLATRGPYGLIRHPLYLTELISLAGVLASFAQPGATLVFLATFALLIPRMHYEEALLKRVFPEYTAYSDHTWRLIPWIY